MGLLDSHALSACFGRPQTGLGKRQDAAALQGQLLLKSHQKDRWLSLSCCSVSAGTYPAWSAPARRRREMAKPPAALTCFLELSPSERSILRKSGPMPSAGGHCPPPQDLITSIQERISPSPSLWAPSPPPAARLQPQQLWSQPKGTKHSSALLISAGRTWGDR